MKKKVWEEFVLLLKKNKLTLKKLRPYGELSKEKLMNLLKKLKSNAKWEEWESPDAVHQVKNKLHYLISLTYNGNKSTYCFTFLKKNDEWYFVHIETITIRLDKISSFPAKEFPDISVKQKKWIREERYWTKQVRIFNILSEERGKEFAFKYFKDGAGYILEAKTWVPLVLPSRAFVLYLCWEQSNLKGNKVTLEKLKNNEALIRIRFLFLEIYKNTTHLKDQISFDNFKKIIKIMWTDRAEQAGWNIKIRYDQEECIFYLKRNK